ncbi:PIG-L deacetylase family protein [Nocardiopsis dassonvillei]|uniref:PIG-L deacetylase family protein n=1 Tax=Nocardiopsis dassonvillei TaxID=2014 RepID=UPI0033D18834
MTRSRAFHGQPFKIIAFSPHLDDAVMSVGGLLAAAKETGWDMLVCTLFSGDAGSLVPPSALAFHKNCGLRDNAVEVRREEDKVALGILGVRSYHASFQDAIYRWRDGSPLCQYSGAMFDLRTRDEPLLKQQLSLVIAEILEQNCPDQVWTCSAQGGHIDHRHTYEAVSKVCREQGKELLLWEDLPYAIGRRLPPKIEMENLLVPEDIHIQLKLTAIENYRSQIRGLWPTGYDWEKDFIRHARQRFSESGTVEPLWKAKS